MLLVLILVNADDATWVGPIYAVDPASSPSAAPVAAAVDPAPAAAVAGTQTLERLDDGLDQSAAPPDPAPLPSPTDIPPAPAPSAPVPATLVPVVEAAVAPAPAAATCPATYLCYPRLGISGPIVPYNDCTGSTDVGTAIRAYDCLSPTYLMGHAYTQMGRIAGWQPGDVVYAYGKAFTVYSALTEHSCQPPILPLAPLSMQTSLSPNTCGPVLVVQAR